LNTPLGNLGLLQANEGNLDDALYSYNAALLAARELGDRQWEGNALCNIGMLHQLQEKMNEARSCLNESLVITRELGHRRLECIVLCNLGIVLERLDATDEAQKHFEIAISLSRELADLRTEGQILSYQGALYVRQKNYIKSMTVLKSAEELLDSVSDKISLAVSYCSRAECEFFTGDPAAAQAALVKARDIAEAVGAKGGLNYT
jgi:tetratricopeptide (TPR) repeat protein